MRAFLLQRIPGGSQAVLSTLAWVEEDGSGSGAGGPRLVSGGLDGSLTEWDLTTLRPAAVSDSFGGAVWALAMQPSPEEGASSVGYKLLQVGWPTFRGVFLLSLAVS